MPKPYAKSTHKASDMKMKNAKVGMIIQNKGTGTLCKVTEIHSDFIIVEYKSAPCIVKFAIYDDGFCGNRPKDFRIYKG